MNFIDNVFVSGIDDIETVVYSIKRNIPVFNLYIIAVSSNNNGVILLSSEFLKNDKYKNMYIAGMCFGKYRAYKLYSEIVAYAISQKWESSQIGQKLIEEK